MPSISMAEPMLSQRRTFASPTPHLLRLPVELRYQIYSYLCPREKVLSPLPSVGINSVSHRLPSSSLLSIHPQLTDEVLDFYYGITTWKLIFSHALNLFRLDPDLRRLEQSPALQRIRKVETVFFCDIVLLNKYPGFRVNSFSTEIRRRADRACTVLSHARRLEMVTVSWIDTTRTGGWPEKVCILEPLRKLANHSSSPDPRRPNQVTFRVGEIIGPDDVDRVAFVHAMQSVLGAQQALETGLDEMHETPSDLRRLAFDVRQERT